MNLLRFSPRLLQFTIANKVSGNKAKKKNREKKIEDQPIEINIIFFRIIFVNYIVRRTKKCLILQLKFIDPNLFSDINSVSLKIGLVSY